jgi:hypothetical protein
MVFRTSLFQNLKARNPDLAAVAYAPIGSATGASTAIYR